MGKASFKDALALDQLNPEHERGISQENMMRHCKMV